MLQVAGREREGRLRIEDIDNFPCEDLRTINQLWLDYSNGKFGFSVQKEIYESLGGTTEYNQKVWEKFGNRVGWRKGGIFKEWKWLSYEDYDLTFEIDAAPKAHLPGLLLPRRGCTDSQFKNFYREGEIEDSWKRFFSLAQRLVSCRI